MAPDYLATGRGGRVGTLLQGVVAGGGDPTVEARLAFNLLDLWHRPARKRVSEYHLERTILQAVIEAYIETAEPAGSRRLVRRKFEVLKAENGQAGIEAAVTEKLENSKAVINARRDIARIKTILREGQLQK